MRCKLPGRRAYSSWVSASLPCVVGEGFAIGRTPIGGVGRGAIVAGSSAQAGLAIVTSSNPLTRCAEHFSLVVAAARCKARVLLEGVDQVHWGRVRPWTGDIGPFPPIRQTRAGAGCGTLDGICLTAAFCRADPDASHSGPHQRARSAIVLISRARFWCAQGAVRTLAVGVLTLVGGGAMADRLPRTMAPDPVGAGTGSGFTADCGERSALVGIAGTAGDLVDSLAPVCVLLDPVTGSWAGVPREGTRSGGTGGSAYEILCRPGDVMVGIGGTEAGDVAYYHEGGTGRRGGPISGLWPYCARTRITERERIGAPHWRETGDDYYQGGDGRVRAGSGHGLAFVRLCPGEYFLRGLGGESAATVSQIGLDCQRLDRRSLPHYTIAVMANPPVNPEGKIAYFPVPPIKLAWQVRSGAPATLAPFTRFAFEVLDISRSLSRIVEFQGGPSVDYPSPTQIATSSCTPGNVTFGRQFSIDSRGRNYCFDTSQILTLPALPNGQYVLLLKARGFAADGHTSVPDAVGETQFAFEVRGAVGAPVASPSSPGTVQSPAPEAAPLATPAPVAEMLKAIIRSTPVTTPAPTKEKTDVKEEKKP